MNKVFNFASVQKTFESDEAKFAGFKKLCVELPQGTQIDFTAAEANQQIKDIFMSIIGCDETSSKKDVRRAIKLHKDELFAISEEIIPNLLISGWGENPFFKDYAEIRNLDIGDSAEFYVEDNSVLSVGKLSGNHVDIKRQRLGAGTRQTISTSWYGLAVYAEYERFLTGAEDWSALVLKVVDAFNRYINEAIYRALLEAGSSLGAQWQKTGSLVAATLRNLVMDVEMATGAEAIVMGTRAALANVTALQNVDWASSNMKDEKYKTGRLGFWEGTRLVELPQGFKLNDTTNYLVDNSKLFIMPVKDNRFIKLVFEGEANISQITDKDVNQDLSYEYIYQQKLGIAILTNLKWGLWNITA